MKAVNSPIRDIAKYILGPLKGTSIYSYIQAWSMSRDIVNNVMTEAEIELLNYAIIKGENVIDIGANYGMYTYHMSNLVGENGNVIAFEPIPFTFKTLTKICKRLSLKNVTLHMLAISDKNELASFKIPLQAAGHLMAGQAYLGSRKDNHGDIENQVRWNKTTEIISRTIHLDGSGLIREPISLIKLDIEGAEYFALKGAKKLIDENDPTIIMEINPWFLDGFSYSIDDLIEPLFKQGYKMYMYLKDQKILKPITTFESVLEANYVFIHKSKLNRFKPLLRSI
tara:strand:- start:6509 stop:7357 length:849 start_codon:yes stop_codon:yes gene_type:complete